MVIVPREMSEFISVSVLTPKVFSNAGERLLPCLCPRITASLMAIFFKCRILNYCPRLKSTRQYQSCKLGLVVGKLKKTLSGSNEGDAGQESGKG